ncbi:unnamed protein product [Schistosoma mattheei]|uniref:E3 ubiquitin-protein ligase MARCHF5 n=1 Tax=Schistosoma mattheei TaxID=31246 RepID=A0AA85BQK7_9TREM|nr:unnamed protein product [Schistosoma mattheei]
MLEQSADASPFMPREDKTCWICLSSEVDGNSANLWSRPCRCRGALKWVHQTCLQRWISEQQHSRGESNSISCQICNTPYIIVYPDCGFFYDFLQSVDQITRSLSFVLTGGIIFGSFYWSAVTYGAVTVMQVYGHRQGLQAMRLTDPPLLLLGLPTIPLCLVLAKAVQWESRLLMLWRNHISRLPFIQLFRRKDLPTWPVNDVDIELRPELSDIPRLFCSALALPTISTVLGHLLFKRVQSATHRVLLGGLTYLGVKGLLTIYYQELQYIRICYRQVKDYDE